MVIVKLIEDVHYHKSKLRPDEELNRSGIFFHSCETECGFRHRTKAMIRTNQCGISVQH